MNRKESSLIKNVNYNESKMNLDVELKTSKNNAKYTYSGVPKNVYEAFMNAQSMGNFFNKEIKNKYNLLNS